MAIDIGTAATLGYTPVPKDGRNRDRSVIATITGRRAGRHRPRAGLVVMVAMTWLAAVIVLAVCADWLPLARVGVPVGEPLRPPGFRFNEPLGNDGFGRSQLSRVVYGARVSLAVGFGSTAIGFVIGGLIGSVAGFARGRVDAVINVVIDAALAFPALVFLLALASVLRPTVPTLIGTIGILTVPVFARLARANTLRFASRDFVTAARLMGATRRRILFREIIANAVFPVATYAFLLAAVVIVVESSLSFLGLGIAPPQPTWGNMIEGGRRVLATDAHVVFVPAITMLLTVFSLNVIGDHALERLDRRGSQP